MVRFDSKHKLFMKTASQAPFWSTYSKQLEDGAQVAILITVTTINLLFAAGVLQLAF